MGTIRTVSAEISVEEYLKSYVDIPKFLGLCAMCGNYEKRWACPPYDFDVEGYWRQHSRLLLRGLQLFPTAEERARTYTQEELRVLLRATLQKEKAALLSRLEEESRSYPGSVVLSAGTCEVCPVCTRTEQKPCRFPGRAHYSIESLGGDVGKTAHELLGFDLLWAKDGVIPEYWSLVGGILV